LAACCLDGKNACPPEDCGGIWGYYDLLKAVKNPKHKEHRATITGSAGPFDPGYFDLQKINAKLRGLGNLTRPSPFSTH
jgi:Plasmid pRiA4b ORF-3-like protein